MGMTNNETVSFINTSLGNQIAAKAIHWKTLSNSEHGFCDDFYDKLVDFTDKIVEGASSIWGRPETEQINPEIPTELSGLAELISSYVDTLNDYISYLEIVKETESRCRGLLSVCDDFMNELNVTFYRAELK